MPPFSFKKICQWCAHHEAAQRGENSEAPQPVMAAPWVRRESSISLTQILFGANVAVFIAMILSSGNPLAYLNPMQEFPARLIIPYGANWGPDTLSGDWWRLFSYMFLHGSLLHIAFNMWCLWDLGALCESLYGRWTYAAIYLITGVAGGLASIGWNPGVLSLGASGAIFGLAGALLASFYLGEFSLPKMAIQRTLRSLGFFVVINLFIGGAMGGVDNACHIGGLVSGLILGAGIARFAPFRASHRLAVLGVVALAVLGCALGLRQWRGGSMRISRAFEEFRQKGNAIGGLEMIVKQDPKEPRAHFALAQAYFDGQQFPKAEAEFKRVLELQPNNLDARFDLGVTYLNEQRLDDARAAFQQILAKDASNSDAHYGLGLVFAAQENNQSAVAEFQAATHTDTPIPGLYLELGNSYAKQKMYDEAISAYKQEKDKNGDNADLEDALAEAYTAKGMIPQAQDAKNKSAQLRTEVH